MAIGGAIASAFSSGIPFPYNLIAAGVSATIAGGLATAQAVAVGENKPQRASFAVGAAQIPQDTVADIHKDEMIVPATFAESIRDGDLTLSGRNSNGEPNVAGSNQVVIQFLNSDTMEVMKEELFESSRDGTFKVSTRAIVVEE